VQGSLYHKMDPSGIVEGAVYSHFFIAASVLCFSSETAPVEMRLPHVEHSFAEASKELT